MLETLFLAGAFLQITWICTSHKPRKFRIASIAAVLLVSMLVGLVSSFITEGFSESILMIGMVGGGLVILTLGLFSMKGAKIWRPIELLALQSIMLLALSMIQNTEIWIIATQIGLPVSFLCLLLSRTWPLFCILPYFWTLILSLVLEVVYVLPLMALQDPPPFDVFLVGSLFTTLGISGFFALKFCTMCVASLLSQEKGYRTALKDWMNRHLPLRYAPVEDSLLLLLMLGAIGSFIFGAEWIPTTVMLLLLGVLLRKRVG